MARKLTKLAQQATAYHEAGHAVVAFKEGVGLHRATIIPMKDFDGRVEHARLFSGIQLDCDNSLRARGRVEKKVKICFAGPIAQRRFNPRTYRHYHSEADHQCAVDLLSYVVESNEELEAYLKLLSVQTESIVEHYWPIIAAVAQTLLERRKLFGRELKEVVEKAFTHT